MICLSPLHVAPDSQYAYRAREAGIRALSSLEIEEQTERMRARLTSTHQANPKLARYDIREFVY